MATNLGGQVEEIYVKANEPAKSDSWKGEKDQTAVFRFGKSRFDPFFDSFSWAPFSPAFQEAMV